MQTLNQLTQSHLSVLILGKDSHNPIVRMPIYAELSIVQEAPPYEISRDDLGEIEGIYQDIEASVLEVLRSSLAQYIEENTFRAWNEEKKRDFLNRVFNILDDEGYPFPDSESEKKEIVDRAILKAMEEFEIPQSQTPNKKSIYSYPLGYLATDHVGYASFDLTRISDPTRPSNNGFAALERSRVQTSYAFFVYPMGKEGTRFDALEQGRFTDEAIFAKLSVEQPTLTRDLKILNLPSMQKPSLVDWYFSPGSFAAHPEFLIGEDGCELLFPAQIALQEFNLRQVVRVVGASPVPLPEGYKFAYVDDYRVTWHSLGHSLGEILYSLPLAPGESVKLAVIDWSWESTTQRTEQTVLTEDILHKTHRDRMISETVKAGLRELQKGSSFMGGVATSAGGSGSTGAIGVAIGNAWSLGGSTATSQGSRDLVAENVQRLNDSFSQASSAQREINSTVVVQARQEEKESIQTRTFTNYNHSHTLTILYYEILRHFKVEVEWVRRRQAVLVKIPTQVTALDEAALIKNRFLLEPVLLNPALKSGFDALEKREATANHQKIHGINPTTAVPEPWWEGDVELELFELGLRSPDDTVNPIVVYIITAGDHANSKRLELHYVYKGLNNEDIEYDAHNINSGTRIKWKDVLGFQFEKWGNTEWRIDGLAIRGWDRFGFVVKFTEVEGLVPVDLFVKGKEPGSQTFSKIKPPGPRPALPAPILSPEKSLSAEEAYQIKKLNDHFDLHKDYYNQVICLNKDPNTIAIEFESVNWDGTSKLIDHVEPYPLETFGSYVAYPFIDTNNQLPELNLESLKKHAEKLITLPTRGVFAEGKLGHCNVSEEIDNTRFWKWEEHPIPFEAPGINPATPITPQPQQTDATPTAFPSSLVNIVNPSAAPDPTGLAAALTVLGTPNIFRDMSGQQEVADLLKKLSDNTISIAEAANKAREIQSKSGGGGSGKGSSNSSETPRSRPNQPSNATQDMHDMQPVLERAQERGLMKPEVAQNIYETAARERFTPESLFQNVTDRSSNWQPFQPRPTSEKYLREAANGALYDAFDIQNYFMDVTGLNFVQWFRTYVGGRGKWAGLTINDDTATLSHFTGIWNAIPDLFDARYATLVEFAALMAIFLNETGGSLAFRLAERVGNTEHPGLSYPFEAFEIIRSDGNRIPKASYNRSPNRTALQNFQDPIFLQYHGQLAPADTSIRNDPRWGGTSYPRNLITTELSSQTQFIQQADFYKFRGRGPIQLTWRSAYEALVSFVKAYSGTQSVVLEYKQRWANLSNADAATASTNQDWDRLFSETDMVIHIASIRQHNRLSGGYLPLSTDPAALRGNGRGSIVFLATKIAGNNPEYTLLVRDRVLELLGAIEAMPARPLGMGQGGIDL